MKKIGVFFLSLFLFCSPAFPAEYHIYTTGNDTTGNGTKDYPFASLDKALSVISPGDTITAHGGMYENKYSTTNTDGNTTVIDGTANARITIRAAAGETPIFTAAHHYTSGGWTNAGTNIWRTTAAVGFPTQQVWGAWQIENDGTVHKLNTNIGGVAGTTCVTNLTANPNQYQYCSTAGNSPGDRVYLYSTTDPNTDAAAGVSWYFVCTAAAVKINHDYYDLNGINARFSYTGISNGAGANHNTYKNYTSQYNVNYATATSTSVANPTTDLLFQNCYLLDTVAGNGTLSTPNQYGFKATSGVTTISGSYITIDNCEIARNNGHGVQFSEAYDHMTIINSTSHDNNAGNTSPDVAGFRMGLQLEGSHFTFKNNISYNNHYGLVFFGDINDVEVSGNIVYGNSLDGVWIDDNSASRAGINNVFKNNIIYGNTGYGLKYDVTGTSWEIDNNTIDANAGGGIKVTATVVNGYLRNNAVTAPTGTNVFEVVSGGTVDSDYNAFYSPDASPFSYGGVSYDFAGYKAAASQDSHSINTDFTAEFINYAAHNYRLGLTAANLKDSGQTISTVKSDRDGTSRPRGSGQSIGMDEEGGVYKIR